MVAARAGWRRTLWVGIVVFLTGVAAPLAQEPAEEGQQLITMDFQEVEIGVLVKFISEITGRNFILDDRVRGKVTVISPTRITIPEAYQVFQSILDVKGFTTVPAGPATKIVPTRDAKQAGMPFATGVEEGDEFVTQLVPLSFVGPDTLLPILQPMVSSDGLVSAYGPTNTLILIDTARNVQRLLRMISELDVEAPERGLEVFELENAFAVDLAATIEQILEATEEFGGTAPASTAPPETRQRRQRSPAEAATAGAGEGGGPVRVTPDPRTNSLIVVAGASRMRMIRGLIRELDREIEGVSKINVYRLRYANALEMIDVLSQLIGEGTGAGLSDLGSPRRRTTRQQQQRGGGLGGLQGQLGQALQQQRGGLGGARRGLDATQQREALSPASATGTGADFVGEVRVTADPFTNSLIISAAPQDYAVIREVIEQVDIPRRQVLVEAIILEVSLDKTRELGFELQGGVPLRDGIGLGRLNLESLNAAVTNPGSISGLLLAAASNQTVTLPDGTVVPAQVALFTALQRDTDVNILSAPTIVTSDNQEAEILVGQNVPFIASRATDTTNLANVFQTVQRQDVGITLRLTPQVSEGDVVRLDLYEEVSSVVPNPPVDPSIAGPTTTIRSASTTIVARNGQTVAIGGLISDDITLSESKVPFIGDVPVIGNLFKSTRETKSKVNLLIFLTPYVIRDEQELQAVSRSQRDRMQESLRRHGARPDRSNVLNHPGWDRELPARPVPTPSLIVPAPEDPPRPEPTPEPRAQLVPTPRPEPSPELARRREPAAPVSPAALGIPERGYQFAVLLSLWERGDPPPGLETTNGFLTLYFPEEGATFFEKGGTYEYETSRYQARYSCLEVFSEAREALAVYPEGQPVEQWEGAAVRWRPISRDQMRRILADESRWKRTR